ncbi:MULTISPECIES: cupin domain-containing protein [unclassified Achromobacter]|uniref:cupin domain-containing protein n=1 Tax=unclassified Achromobacter TaxID=2626865 RepID=UPI001303D117|nr:MULTISPECIES: cupin domain-containing protein [unclassified Achromobacter]
MPQIINRTTLPNYYATDDPSLAEAADSARIDMRMAHGNKVSLAVAVCQPGYHPAPQIHATEQLNYVAEGEIWIYIDGDAYHLQAGDAIRVPKMKPHWMWNRSEHPCTFYESNCPPLAGDAQGAGALFEGDVPAQHYPHVVWLSDKYAKEVEDRDAAAVEGPLLARADSLATSVHGGAIGAAAAGKLTSKCIHGLEHNMTLARRKGGYHSAPHIHDAEQLHTPIKGDIDIFTSDFGFACREGDFNIVPSNTPHWAEVSGDEDNILLQAHSPVLGSAANRKALLTDEERGLPIFTVFNMTPWREQDIMNVEQVHRKNMQRS